jgi:hypothetical protein
MCRETDFPADTADDTVMAYTTEPGDSLGSSFDGISGMADLWESKGSNFQKKGKSTTNQNNASSRTPGTPFLKPVNRNQNTRPSQGSPPGKGNRAPPLPPPLPEEVHPWSRVNHAQPIAISQLKRSHLPVQPDLVVKPGVASGGMQMAQLQGQSRSVDNGESVQPTSTSSENLSETIPPDQG